MLAIMLCLMRLIILKGTGMATHFTVNGARLRSLAIARKLIY